MAKSRASKTREANRKAAAAIEHAVKRGIDALDLLRVLMREAGMLACADALDDAFAKCVKEYIERKDEGTIGQRPHRRRPLKKLN
jgi:hypothetical protein